MDLSSVLNLVVRAIHTLYAYGSSSLERKEAQEFLCSIQNGNIPHIYSSDFNVNNITFICELAFECFTFTSNENVQFFGAQTLFVLFKSANVDALDYLVYSNQIINLLRSASPNAKHFVLIKLCAALALFTLKKKAFLQFNELFFHCLLNVKENSVLLQYLFIVIKSFYESTESYHTADFTSTENEFPQFIPSSITLSYFEAFAILLEHHVDHLSDTCLIEIFSAMTEVVKKGNPTIPVLFKTTECILQLNSPLTIELLIHILQCLQEVMLSMSTNPDHKLCSKLLSFVLERLSPSTKAIISDVHNANSISFIKSVCEFTSTLIEAHPHFFLLKFNDPLFYFQFLQDFLIHNLMSVSFFFNDFGSHLDIHLNLCPVFTSLQEAFSELPSSSLASEQEEWNPNSTDMSSVTYYKGTHSKLCTFFEASLIKLVNAFIHHASVGSSYEHSEKFQDARSNASEMFEALYFVLFDKYYETLYQIFSTSFLNFNYDLMESALYSATCIVMVKPASFCSFLPSFINHLASQPFQDFPTNLRNTFLHLLTHGSSMLSQCADCFPFILNLLPTALNDVAPMIPSTTIHFFLKLSKDCDELLSPHFWELFTLFTPIYTQSSFSLRQLILEAFSLLASKLPPAERPRSYSSLLQNVSHELEQEITELVHARSQGLSQSTSLQVIIENLNLLCSFFSGVQKFSESLNIDAESDTLCEKATEPQSFLISFVPFLQWILSSVGDHPQVIYHICELIKIVVSLKVSGLTIPHASWTPVFELLLSLPKRLYSSICTALDAWMNFEVSECASLNLYSFYLTRAIAEIQHFIETDLDSDLLKAFLSSAIKSMSLSPYPFHSILSQIAELSLKSLDFQEPLLTTEAYLFLEKYLAFSPPPILEVDVEKHKQNIYALFLPRLFEAVLLQKQISQSLHEQNEQFLFKLLQYTSLGPQSVLKIMILQLAAKLQVSFTEGDINNFTKLLVCANSFRRFQKVVKSLQQKLSQAPKIEMLKCI